MSDKCEVDHKQLYWGWIHEHGHPYEVDSWSDDELAVVKVFQNVCPTCPKCDADLEKEVKNG